MVTSPRGPGHHAAKILTNGEARSDQLTHFVQPEARHKPFIILCCGSSDWSTSGIPVCDWLLASDSSSASTWSGAGVNESCEGLVLAGIFVLRMITPNRISGGALPRPRPRCSPVHSAHNCGRVLTAGRAAERGGGANYKCWLFWVK